jgi:3-oxoacyl-[acyl-carrier-protein] synthase-1
MSQRAVVTGIGVLSCLGNSVAEVDSSLRLGRSGIERIAAWEALGLRSTIGGPVRDVEALTESASLAPRELLTLSRAALYALLATHQALADADLAAPALRSHRTAVIVGSGVGDTTTIHRAASEARAGRARRIDAYSIVKSMSNAPAAAIVRRFGVGGRSYSLASACASSSHAIGHAAELVRAGLADVVIAGGTEEIDDLIAAGFSALRSALSSRSNERPEAASRPFAEDRDGFVLASGAGVLVVESASHAEARGARIRAEIAGFGANSDDFDLVLPEPSGARAAQCMELALADAGARPEEVDAINVHATATPAGDLAEAAALRRVFARLPPVASSKSLGGHALGASGVHEAIHCILQLEGGFLAPSINSEPRDPALRDLPVVTEARRATPRLMLSNSFGFGGTHAVLAIRRA